MTLLRALILLCLAAFPAAAQEAAPSPQPNIVLVLVDDMSMNLMPGPDKPEGYMPHLTQMMADGMTFENFFTVESLCCPSRAALLTGMMPHNTGVRTNMAPMGGLEAFTAAGNEAKTFALALQSGGYRTAFLGKYLNGAMPSDEAPIGWNKWVMTNQGYQGFGYTLNNNGVLSLPPEHLTDTIASLGKAWINLNKMPFFAEFAPFSPHKPYVAAERHLGLFPTATMPKTPAYGARPDVDDPAWLQSIPTMKVAFTGDLEKYYRERLRAMMSIDDMIGDIRTRLTNLGIAGNTYIIFTSDNGYHMGEYSLRPGKMTPFKPDTNVPFVVVGPGIAAGSTSDAILSSIDLAPTFLDIAGLPIPANMDGMSMLPQFGGAAGWRSMAVVEHWNEEQSPDDPDSSEPKAGDPPTYTALQGDGWLFVEYLNADGLPFSVGYYEDPFQLSNTAANLTPERLAELRATAAANRTCVGADCRALQAQ